MFRKFISIVMVIVFWTICVIPANAATVQTPSIGAIISIEDPITGAVWTWYETVDKMSITTTKTRSSDSSTLISEWITVDIGEYLAQTYGARTSGETTVYDDIRVSTGLTYTANAERETVRLHNVFGSTSQSGDYYATNREVIWRNPGSGDQGTFAPNTNSWNYPVVCEEGAFNDTVPPFSRINCEIHINGMTAYKNITVTFFLFLFQEV